MNTPRAFSDEDLTAFLDGEADDALMADISAALETDPDLAERMAGLEIPMAAITEAFDQLLGDTPAMPALPTPEAATPAPANTNAPLKWAWGLGTFGTGIAAGLAVALFTGFGTPEPAPRGWVSFVASYQTLYTTATLTEVNPTAAEAATQLASVS